MRYCEICRASFQALRTCPKDRVPLRADLDDPLVGHVLGGRYRILEPIAAGGMGQVYRAAHTRIASLYALKVLYGDLAYDPEMRARFKREAEAAACLQSRHIVRVVDFNESDEGLLYIAMEHLVGEPLSSVVANEGALAPERAIAIAIQVARGLAHAHERGVVHRDLKPANVMLVREDDEPDVVRLLDFGIARLGGASGLTQAGAVMGTPEYMAPEQYLGGAIDARADLYALGVMLYELLTGEIPFASDSLASFARMHLHEPPAPLSTRRTRGLVQRELEGVLMRLLKKSPADRYASAREVIDALRTVPAAPPRSTRSPAGPESRLPEPIAGNAALERIHAAIQLGAPTYNAGDHAGCGAIYREAAEALLAGGLREATRQASSARLEVAIRRANASGDATRAAWELRWAFDDVSLVLRFVGGTELATELAAAGTISSARYASGELDLVADYQAAFAARLASWLRDRGGDARVVAQLDRAVFASRGASPEGVIAQMGRTLDGLREGVRATEGPASSELASLRPSAATGQRIAAQITEAIRLGAPAYNRGDRNGCFRIYREIAEELAKKLIDEPGCSGIARNLVEALDRARGLGDTQGAWALRHVFDELIAELTPR